MSTNNWIAVIGSILIILATLFGRWWLQHHQYRKQNNTKMAEVEDFDIDYNEVAYDRNPEEADVPIQDRWPVFDTPELDLLTSAFDDAHPNKKHYMYFKSKNYDFAMDGVVYKFRCFYCNFDVKLKKKDFWGTPKPRVDGGLTEEWANWGRRKYEIAANSGLLYIQPNSLRVGEFKQPQRTETDRSDALTTNLLAYAEYIKMPQNPSEDPRYEKVQRLVRIGDLEAAQTLEEKIWMDIRAAAAMEEIQSEKGERRGL